jgi:hypothetical protein
MADPASLWVLAAAIEADDAPATSTAVAALREARVQGSLPNIIAQPCAAPTTPLEASVHEFLRGLLRGCARDRGAKDPGTAALIAAARYGRIKVVTALLSPTHVTSRADGALPGMFSVLNSQSLCARTPVAGHVARVHAASRQGRIVRELHRRGHH